MEGGGFGFRGSRAARDGDYGCRIEDAEPRLDLMLKWGAIGTTEPMIGSFS